MRIKISPSIMCVDLLHVEEAVTQLNEACVDYFHIDIMDNHFVPNIALNRDFLAAIRSISRVPMDIHLMIEEPESSIKNYYGGSQDDIITIHYEATTHVQRTIGMIKDLGVKAGVALNPATPLCMLDNILPDIDVVLIMLVNPGFMGQELIPQMFDKIRLARRKLDEAGYENIEIEVDGNVNFQNIGKMRTYGANIFVGGSSSIFSKEGDIVENCNRLKQLALLP